MQARDPPVGLGPEYLSTGTTTLYLTHHTKWLKMHGEYKVRDAAGKMVFTIRLGKGAHQRKELKDAKGQLLLHTSTRVFKENRETTGCLADGKEALVMKQKDTKLGRTGIKVDYTDPLRGKTQLIIRAASWKSTKATIADGQGIIGEIRWGRSRKKEGPKKRRDGDCWGTDYDVTVAAGVDTALITMLCALYGAMRTEKAVAAAAEGAGASAG